MKKFVDKRHTEVSYEEGAWVFVHMQPYRQHSVSLRRNQKLSMHYFGPFQVIQKIGIVAYRLQLLPGATIHPLFYVSVLRPCHGDPDTDVIPLPLLTADYRPLIQPAYILQARSVIQ